ncbi:MULTISPECIES: hypothetical protein [Chitinophagaceae]
MKIVTFFATIVAAVLLGFLLFFVKTHEDAATSHLRIFLLSQNDDGFRLNVNTTEFNSDQAEEGNIGRYSYIGMVPKINDSAHITFKNQYIDTTLSIAVNNIDSLVIGTKKSGQLYVGKL